jgi:hypothetical protein
LYKIWGPILIYEINAPSPKDHSKFFHHPASDVTVVQKKSFTSSSYNLTKTYC